MRYVIQTWLISNFTFGDVDVVLVAHDCHIDVSIILSWRPVLVTKRFLDFSKVLSDLSKLSIDLFTVGFSLISVLVELPSQVELQVHFEWLGEATPFLLVEAFSNIICKFLFPNKDWSLDIVGLDVTKSQKNLLAFNNHWGLLLT